MAKQTLLASFVSIASNDLSAYCSKIELKAEVERQDATTFGSSGWSEKLNGIRSWELGLTFKQDVAASAIDSIMWPLFIANASVAAIVRLNSSAVSTSNPNYSGSIIIGEWMPINGSVGDVAELDVTFEGTGALTRATS
jgi:hypothetical protein